MLGWSVGTKHAPGKFSGHCDGEASNRKQAMSFILTNAQRYFIPGCKSFAIIRNERGQVENVLKEVQKFLKKSAGR